MIQGSHFSAAKGGAQYQAQVLVEQLVRSGDFDVAFVTRNAAADYIPDGYAIERLKPNRLFRRFGFFADAPQLSGVLRRRSPNVIYQQGLKGHTGIAARYAKQAGARFIFHVASDFDVTPSSELAAYDFKSVSGIDKKLGEWGLRNAHRVIVQTKVQQELLLRHYGRGDSLIVKNFHPLPLESVTRGDKVKVVWVANFKAVKRPELFVKLAESFAGRSDCEFAMIGRGGDPASYGELHKRIEQLDNLTFFGERSQEEVNLEIAKSHILVNTSSMEGFPNTFIQAWMRDVPVVSLGVNTDGLFDSEEMGFCTADFAELCSKIDLLVTNHDVRQKMARFGRTYALQNHSLSNVDSLIDLLRTV